MWPNYSYTSIDIALALMLASSVSLAADNLPHKSKMPDGKTIYGLSNAQYFKGQSEGNFYIQAGTFKSEKNAANYKRQLVRKYHYPVIIEKQGNYHIALIGPIHSAAEVRAINGSAPKVVAMDNDMSTSTIKPKHNDKHLLVISDKDAAISPAKSSNHLEVIGALGVANLNAEDGYLGVTSSETDRLVQTNGNDWNAFTGQLGIGYLYYLQGAQQYSENTQWFPWIEPEINGYYLGSGSIKGDVWRFGSPVFNDMTYSMPIQSYRLMFDLALTVASKKQYSLYAIGGIGNAWNRLGYSDADRNGIPCADQFLNLNTATRSNFAWEAGAGLSYAFNNRFSLSLEYLYTDLGRVETPATGLTGTIFAPVISPANFTLTSQAALLGLHIAI